MEPLSGYELGIRRILAIRSPNQQAKQQQQQEQQQENLFHNGYHYHRLEGLLIVIRNVWINIQI